MSAIRAARTSTCAPFWRFKSTFVFPLREHFMEPRNGFSTPGAAAHNAARNCDAAAIGGSQSSAKSLSHERSGEANSSTSETQASRADVGEPNSSRCLPEIHEGQTHPAGDRFPSTGKGFVRHTDRPIMIESHQKKESPIITDRAAVAKVKCYISAVPSSQAYT